jgi:uncharacterized membrane protein YphA (DoxX/SURF4 family)
VWPVNRRRWLATTAPRATLWIRIAAAAVFITEGVLKASDPAVFAAGRFAKIGIPLPGVSGPFVTGVELVGGALLLLGLATRFAAIALALDMVVALVSTKLPILVGHGVLGFAAATAKPGLWSTLHEARTDISMLCATIFLAIVGAGAISLDARLAAKS